MNRQDLTLLTDFYELTMMQGYYEEKQNETVIFDVFFRQNPCGNGYSVCAGLEQVIDYVKNLNFTYEDVDYLRSLHIFSEDFLHYLSGFHFSGDIYAIPEGSRTARGTAIVNLIQLQPGEKITALIPIREYKEGRFLFMATKKGLVKKTPITDFANVRKIGLTAITLRDDDELIEVKFTNNKKDIFLVTKYGQCIRFHETDVRKTGRASMGVIGMSLSDGDEVVGMQLDTQGEYLLIASEYGMGKLTPITEFSAQNRGGKGVKCYKIMEKTGNVVGVKAVNREHEIMMINTEGIIIQMACEDISVLGRVTSGVKLMSLDPEQNVRVASIAKVKDSAKKNEEDTLKSLEEELKKEE